MIYLRLGTKGLIKIRLPIEEIQLLIVTRLGYNIVFKSFFITGDANTVQV